MPWRRDRLPTPVLLGFPGGSAGKECACSVGDLGSIPGLGRSPGEGNSYPLQSSCLRIPMDRGAWGCCIPWGLKELDRTERLSTHSTYMLEFAGGEMHIKCFPDTAHKTREWRPPHPHTLHICRHVASLHPSGAVGTQLLLIPPPNPPTHL